MLVFHFPAQRRLAAALLKRPGYRPGRFLLDRYEAEELYLELKTPVRGQHCLIIGETAPPDQNLLALLMLIDTLRQSGAKQIDVLVPYLGYSRQEHLIKDTARNAYLVGKLLQTAGADKLITIDVHNSRMAEDYPLPLISLNAQPIFAPLIKRWHNQHLTLLAPDSGAVERCRQLNTPWPIAFFEKQRRVGFLKLQQLRGELSPRVLMFDDILNTGATLVLAVDRLRRQGVKHIDIMVSHGQFNGKLWRQLLKAPVHNLYVSDSCPEARQLKHPKIKVLSCLPAINQYLENYAPD